MAGAKGRSGGPRANSGGARPGAGRKPKPKAPPVQVVPVEAIGGAAAPVDMLDLLQKVALGVIVSTPLQVRAAIAAVQYTHTKRGDGGKKDELGRKAEKAAAGKFASAAPPRLAAAGGKAV